MKSIFVETETREDKIENAIMSNFMPEMIKNDEVALTFDNKIAIKRRTGEYVTYDAEANIITNHLDLVMDMPNIFMLIPTSTIAEGDIIKEKNTYYYVKGVVAEKVNCVNLSTGNINHIVQEQNVITGSKMFRKVQNILSVMTNNTENNNINNILPLLLMKDGKDSDSFTKLFMFNAMNGNTNNLFGNTQINPMMLAFMKDKDFDVKDLLMFNMMNNNSTNV